MTTKNLLRTRRGNLSIRYLDRMNILTFVQTEIFSSDNIAVRAFFIGEKRLLRDTLKVLFFYLPIHVVQFCGLHK